MARTTDPGAAPGRPTRRELEAARGGAVPDLVHPGLRVLFCGINPSLYSVAVGHHFARPGNRFWPTLHRAGFTPRVLRPDEEGELLALGCGITNVVARATARADELDPAEYDRGAALLAQRVRRLRPIVVAFVGLDAFRRVMGLRDAGVGPGAVAFAGARTWALPNPSGLNAHYQLAELGRVYAALRAACESWHPRVEAPATRGAGRGR